MRDLQYTLKDVEADSGDVDSGERVLRILRCLLRPSRSCDKLDLPAVLNLGGRGSKPGTLVARSNSFGRHVSIRRKWAGSLAGTLTMSAIQVKSTARLAVADEATMTGVPRAQNF